MSNEFPFGNIKPRHYSLQNVDTDQTHDSLVSDYEETPKAFFDLQNVNTDQTHDSLKLSGYQYTSPGSSVLLAFDEIQELGDSAAITNINKTVSETQELTDSAITSPLFTGDSTTTTDSVTLHITLSIEEAQPTTDSVETIIRTIVNVDSDSQPTTDSVNLTIVINIDEPLGLVDTDSEVIQLVEFIGSTRIQIQEINTSLNSTIIHVPQIIDDSYTSYVNIIKDTIVAVTNASSVDNPFEPTIAVNGNILIENPSTTVPVSNTGVFVNVLPTGIIPNNSLCELFNWNINLGFGGGSFSITSQNQIGNRGDNITLFGMNATITELGKVSSNSATGWVTNGIFGVRKMNQQLQLLASVDALNGLTGTQAVQSPPTSAWRTLRDLALALAEVVGVEIVWATKDALLTDLLIQSGMTGIEALNALAAVVGAVVVWDGNTTYTVIDPERGLRGNGLVLPDDCLKISIESRDLLDLQREFTIFPVKGVINNAEIQFPDELNAKEIEALNKKLPLATIKTKVDTGQQYIPVKLPGNYANLWAQILVPADSSATGSFVTNDPNVWFSISNLPVFLMEDKTREIHLTEDLFDTSLSSGDFTMSVAYSEQITERVNAFNKAVIENQKIQSSVTNFIIEPIRISKIGTGTISTIFYGAIPMPGLLTDLSYDGVNLSGIIESVSFSSPGILNITISKFLKVSFVRPRGSYDFIDIINFIEP